MTDSSGTEGKPEQLVLDLPFREALDAEDFLVSECNEIAVRLIDRWPNWPSRALLIVGPAGSGKSHLVNVWRKAASGKHMLACEVRLEDVAEIGKAKAVIVEDIDKGELNENALFHLLNLSKEQDFFLLLTATSLPGGWQVSLPDLRSRLRSLAYVAIGAPDETLLRTVLVKQFGDRQLAVEPHVVNYIALRIERSMDYVRTLVDAIDKAALAEGRKVTKQLAARVMENLSTEAD